ncbi:hypothetical protein [Pseudoxanthomonas sp. PXM02]|uniref:hypothetical protein n=1 Tax=Pseudoxanthomonas sp. PXM02 TaxID=2769294 RepID=UPI001784F923|nr:hypothetical protein [Pseudoxanthomonas sp. PXM02]MBD9479859.1 hypothetical protein [Pseudoxanthomonas sp. PXM02]
MNFGKLGLVLFLVGFVIAAGAGMNWMRLDGRSTYASVGAILANNPYDRMEKQVLGLSLRDDKDTMKLWMIGGSIAAVLGLGIIFAAGGATPATRTCPKCAESVRVAAVVCKHCGAELQPIDSDPDYPANDAGQGDRKYSYRALAKAAEDAERAARGK